jgi:hypothetical protein
MGDGTIVKVYVKRLHRSNAEQVLADAEHYKKHLERLMLAMAASNGQTTDDLPWPEYVAREIPLLFEEYEEACFQETMARELIEFPEDAEDDYDPKNMWWVRERLEEAYTLMVCNCADATCDKCKVSRMLRFITPEPIEATDEEAAQIKACVEMLDNAKIPDSFGVEGVLHHQHILEHLRYWRDLAECDCGSELPTGGCMKCNLEQAIKYVEAT